MNAAEDEFFKFQVGTLLLWEHQQSAPNTRVLAAPGLSCRLIMIARVPLAGCKLCIHSAVSVLLYIFSVFPVSQPLNMF